MLWVLVERCLQLLVLYWFFGISASIIVGIVYLIFNTQTMTLV